MTEENRDCNKGDCAVTGWPILHSCHHCAENNGVWTKNVANLEACMERCTKEKISLLTWKPESKYCRCDKSCNELKKYGTCSGNVHQDPCANNLCGSHGTCTAGTCQ